MATPEISKVSVTEGHGLIEAGATYLDVRTPEEFAQGHYPHAINVPVAVNVAGQRQPNADFVAQVKEVIPDMETQLCVACMGGGRAEAAITQLLAEGYHHIKQMPEGFRGWAAAGLPVRQPGQAA